MIQRYAPCLGTYGDDTQAICDESSTGGFVLHADHVAALAARDELLRQYLADCVDCMLLADCVDCGSSELPVRCPTCTKALTLIGDTPNAKQGEE